MASATAVFSSAAPDGPVTVRKIESEPVAGMISDMRKHKRSELTIRDLIDRLSIFDPDSIVVFGGSEDGLIFNRTKRRGDKLVQIEFEQQVYRDDSGRLVVQEFDEQAEGAT